LTRQKPSGALLLVVVLTLAACTSAPSPPVEERSRQAEPGLPPLEPPPATPVPESPSAGVPAPPASSAATLALLEGSRAASAAGDHGRAISQLERAIRIAPRDASLWTALAAEQVAAGEPALAIQQARKAIALAGDRDDLERDAWLVIADAEQARGNDREAKRIRAQWRTARG
jgi:tetratricopeptide (TPR) repeat protein